MAVGTKDAIRPPRDLAYEYPDQRGWDDGGLSVDHQFYYGFSQAFWTSPGCVEAKIIPIAKLFQCLAYKIAGNHI